jgi:hypothetical protein
MEVLLRAALIEWLAASTSLSGMLNSVTEETPLRASLPWLALSASAAIGWNTKTETGYETRIALELQCRGDQPGSASTLVSAIDSAVMSLPRIQTGFVVTSILFMRSRAEQRADNARAILLEYRFRTQAS